MKLTKDDLTWAASQGLISPDQAEGLWCALKARLTSRGVFSIVNLLYYLGALIVISAMGWLMTLGWESFGGWDLFFIASLYAMGFLIVGRSLWAKDNLKIAGGLLVTMAVCMTPLAVYGLERATGIWVEGNPGVYRGFHEWVRGSWVLMELGTVLAGIVALKFIRFSFLTAPIAFCLWYMSMDLTPLLLGQNEFTWNQRLWVSAWFGLVILVISYAVDRRTREDYAFWGYLFGLMAFWGGLSLMETGSQFRKFLYCVINVGLIVASILLQRRAFIVFGALGVAGYLGYLSYDVFKDSATFPFVLSGIGLLVIFAGVKYQRNSERIGVTVYKLLPGGFRKLLPRKHVAS